MDGVAEGLQDSFVNDFDDGSIGPGRLSAMSAEDDTSSFVLSRSFAGSTVTELSSVFSMSEDDFDKMASRRARLLFDDIDSMLFEHQTSGPPHLIKECLDWQTKFPHLRVLGHRVVDHEEEGFHLYPTNPAANTPTTGSDNVKATSASNNLLVHGRHFDVVGPGLKNNNSTDGSSLGNMEEVLEENGTVEEILAIDYRIGDDDFQILGRKLPNGRPPITPFNCVKDNIISSVFNHLLMQVFPTFKPLLQKIVETVAERNVPDFQSGLETTDDLELSVNSVNSLEKNSRLPALSNSLLGSVPENAALDGVLTIRSKMLLNRERTLGILDGLTETVHGQTIPSVRLNPVLFGNGHTTERHSSLGRIRLLPLENARPQSLVPTAEIDPFSNANLDGLRGHRLATTLSSTTPTPKLPPLQSQRTIMSANVPNTIINRPMQKRHGLSGSVSQPKSNSVEVTWLLQAPFPHRQSKTPLCFHSVPKPKLATWQSGRIQTTGQCISPCCRDWCKSPYDLTQKSLTRHSYYRAGELCGRKLSSTPVKYASLGTDAPKVVKEAAVKSASCPETSVRKTRFKTSCRVKDGLAGEMPIAEGGPVVDFRNCDPVTKYADKVKNKAPGKNYSAKIVRLPEQEFVPSYTKKLVNDICDDVCGNSQGLYYNKVCSNVQVRDKGIQVNFPLGGLQHELPVNRLTEDVCDGWKFGLGAGVTKLRDSHPLPVVKSTKAFDKRYTMTNRPYPSMLKKSSPCCETDSMISIRSKRNEKTEERGAFENGRLGLGNQFSPANTNNGRTAVTRGHTSTMNSIDHCLSGKQDCKIIDSQGFRSLVDEPFGSFGSSSARCGASTNTLSRHKPLGCCRDATAPDNLNMLNSYSKSLDRKYNGVKQGAVAFNGKPSKYVSSSPSLTSQNSGTLNGRASRRMLKTMARSTGSENELRCEPNRSRLSIPCTDILQKNSVFENVTSKDCVHWTLPNINVEVKPFPSLTLGYTNSSHNDNWSRSCDSAEYRTGKLDILQNKGLRGDQFTVGNTVTCKGQSSRKQGCQFEAGPDTVRANRAVTGCNSATSSQNQDALMLGGVVESCMKNSAVTSDVLLCKKPFCNKSNDGLPHKSKLPDIRSGNTTHAKMPLESSLIRDCRKNKLLFSNRGQRSASRSAGSGELDVLGKSENSLPSKIPRPVRRAESHLSEIINLVDMLPESWARAMHPFMEVFKTSYSDKSLGSGSVDSSKRAAHERMSSKLPMPKVRLDRSQGLCTRAVWDYG